MPLGTPLTPPLAHWDPLATGQLKLGMLLGELQASAKFTLGLGPLRFKMTKTTFEGRLTPITTDGTLPLSNSHLVDDDVNENARQKN